MRGLSAEGPSEQEGSGGPSEQEGSGGRRRGPRKLALGCSVLGSPSSVHCSGYRLRDDLWGLTHVPMSLPIFVPPGWEKTQGQRGRNDRCKCTHFAATVATPTDHPQPTPHSLQTFVPETLLRMSPETSAGPRSTASLPVHSVQAQPGPWT